MRNVGGTAWQEFTCQLYRLQVQDLALHNLLIVVHFQEFVGWTQTLNIRIQLLEPHLSGKGEEGG